MYKRLKLNGIYYKIKANLQGESTFNYSNDSHLHYKYKISVKNEKTKKRIYFNFFDSIANYKADIKKLSKADILHAFYCFLNDSLSGYYNFNDFINEYGYNTLNMKEYPRIKKIHNACINSRKKANKINFNSENILCDSINYISEKFDI